MHLYVTSYPLSNNMVLTWPLRRVSAGYKLVCVPVRLEHEKYQRHALSFSVGMVFPKVQPPLKQRLPPRRN